MGMEIVQLDASRLLVREDNSNVMSEELRRKLKRHIERHGYYEPLTVRMHPKREGYYEILNGHHRLMVLKEMGIEQVSCVVWDVGDEEAMMLLATLNRLSGRDDVVKRAELISRLSQRQGVEDLVKGLPDKMGQIKKMLLLHKPLKLREAVELKDMPVVMTFFMSAEQKAMVRGMLEKLRKTLQVSAKKKISDGQLLVYMVRQSIMNNQQVTGKSNERMKLKG